MYKQYAEFVKENREKQEVKNNVKEVIVAPENVKSSATEDTAAAKVGRKNEEKSLERRESTVGNDVMISYSHQNRPTMRKIKGTISVIIVAIEKG